MLPSRREAETLSLTWISTDSDADVDGPGPSASAATLEREGPRVACQMQRQGAERSTHVQMNIYIHIVVSQCG